MEHLSITHLEKYENIFKKIEDEHSKFETLDKQTKQLNNKIIAAGLALRKSVAAVKIFKVFVKIFNSAFEIFDVFAEKIARHELEKASKHANKKLYLVEVYLSQQFLEKIDHQNWMVVACVKNSKRCVRKSLNVRSGVVSPIYLIVPFEDSVCETQVEVSVAWPTESVWSYMKIASIPVDVSYFFQAQPGANNFSKSIVNVCRLYNNLPKSVSQLPIYEYKLPCDLQPCEFFKLVFKNSYHNVDPRKNLAFSKVDDVTIAKVSTGNSNVVTLKHNKSSNTLIIGATLEELHLLKKYFIKELKRNSYAVQENSMKIITGIKNNMESDGEMESDALVNVYNELREIII